MGNLVIVAIPDESDRVWKVSSEKVPHLTLLFLGDESRVSNLESIVQFVEHAANTTLKRFYLPVDHRGELGPDKADVLFFKKGRYDFKAVREFRDVLLKDDNIKTAHDATAQFETPENVGSPGQPWVPHLTLGYPTSPANEIPDNQVDSFYDVSFNRIAVWPGDFEGPEFLLKDYWDECDVLDYAPMDVAMSDIRARKDRALTHYGTKGMKWGQRKTPAQEGGMRGGVQKFLDPQGHKLQTDAIKASVGVLVPIVAPLTWPAQIRIVRGGIRGAKAKALDNQEKKFAKNAMTPKNFVAIHNGAIPKINRDIEAINKKYPDVSNPDTKKKYEGEVLKSMQDGYRASANSLVNKKNTMHLDVEFKNDGMDFKIHAKQGPGTPQSFQVQHADDGSNDEITVEITGKIKRDASGYIVGFEFDDLDPETTMAQTSDLGSEFVLEHFGDPRTSVERGAEFLAHLGLDLGDDALAHYGIKGMHWGRRKETPTAVSPTATSKVPQGTRRKTKVIAKGGENHPASDDAIKVAKSRVKLQKSGTAALSNQELRDLQERMNLERNVGQLVSSTSRIGKGRQFVKTLTGFNKDVNDAVNTGFQTKRLATQH